jgi:hypothetical protein
VERRQRSDLVAFQRRASAAGFSTVETAEFPEDPPRTRLHWCARFTVDGLQERALGRPPWCTPEERRAAVMRLLKTYGPTLSLATLKAASPDVTRAELGLLRSD